MLLVFSEVTELVDAGLIIDMAMLNFSKALDVVSQVLLMKKLRDWCFGYLIELDLGCSVRLSYGD